jgi:peptide chain release factor 2
MESRSERSQHRNYELALGLLQARLYRLEEQKEWPAELRAYDEKGGLNWSHQVRNYVLQPYTLVKDHRAGTQTAAVSGVLDGELDLFLRAYVHWRQGRARV